MAARLGGDEFVLLQTGIAHPSEAELLARRIVRALTEVYEIEGIAIQLGVSVGYSLADGCGSSLDDLLTCADRALYATKRSGGGAAMHGQAAAMPLAAA